jgi:hypothetical protein
MASRSGSENCSVPIHHKTAADRIGRSETSRNEPTKKRDAARSGMRGTAAVDEGSNLQALGSTCSFEPHDESTQSASGPLFNVDQLPLPNRQPTRAQRVVERTADLGTHAMTMDLPESVGMT